MSAEASNDQRGMNNVYTRRVVLSGNPVVGRHVFGVFFAEVVAILFIVCRDFASLSCRKTKLLAACDGASLQIRDHGSRT
ncbi:hypothetical protein KCU85_g98, partial [Aureobasidium melanogenum]